MNSNVSERAKAKLLADKQRYEDALNGYNLTEAEMEIVHEGASANNEYVAAQQEKQGDEGDESEAKPRPAGRLTSKGDMESWDMDTG